MLHDETVRFAVQDSGVGIDAGHQQSMSEPFRQLDGSTTRHYGGVGLGLALSCKLARILKGDIEVESEPGLGSIFTLILPATCANRYGDACTPLAVTLDLSK